MTADRLHERNPLSAWLKSALQRALRQTASFGTIIWEFGSGIFPKEGQLKY
jgi:hypothetical protein